MQVNAYAKINLSLDILGRREDGYHELAMVMQSISLRDVLTVEPAGETSLSCTDPRVPCGPENTLWRAASLFFQETDLPGGVRVALEKHIPSQAGLGGGSADAAALLRALNQMFQTGLAEEALLRLGLQVGADVPFCLRGGAALAQGVGERLSPAPPLPPCFLTVCKPPAGVSTAEAFRRADQRREKGKNHTAAVLEALRCGSLEALGRALGNDFENVMQVPQVEAIKSAMKARGAAGASMTGSGSAVFGLFASREAACSCAAALKGEYPETFFCTPV